MRAALLILALVAPLPALAHPGGEHVSGALAGFLHPLGGLDHLAAMLAVGAWGGLLGGRARWLLPLGFIGGMVAGGLTGGMGVPLPMVEAGIMASVIVLGALVCGAARISLPVCMALLAGFGLLHGHAHAAEIAGAGALSFGIGALSATALLHGLGLLAASRAASPRGRIALRVAGGAASVAALLVAITA